MTKNKKLELTWAGKEAQRSLEPRILLEQKDKSYGDKDTENMLIHGDNLLALKSLEADFSGRIKCIYIDPPYNTGNAFEHYDDGFEHSIWLGLMRDRIELLRNFLQEDGFFCCHIDDSEGAYLKVLLDEIFGRDNYLTTFYIQVRYPEKTLKQDMSFHKEIEQIHIYRKKYGAIPNQPRIKSSFDKFIFYIKEKTKGKDITIGGKAVTIFQEGEYEIYQSTGSEDGLKEIWASGTILDGNSSGRFFRDYLTGRVTIDGLGVLYKVYGIGDDKFDYRYFTGPKKATATKGKYYQGVPLEQLENPEQEKAIPIENFYDFAGAFGNCRLEGDADFRSGKKPEILLERVLTYFSSSGDIILDSFLGSGTTAAVAHKMGRRWIGIELGEHAYSHCLPRLQKVINGSDQGGISKTLNWKGGGGFKFYELASSLIVKDSHGFDIISKEYNADMLAEALCKIMGYKYSPDKSVFWKQGKGTEKNWLFTTTMTLADEYLEEIHSELGDESLLICCGSFIGNKNLFKNITIKKIPKVILEKCEWNKPGYPLPVSEDFIEADFEFEEEL